MVKIEPFYQADAEKVAREFLSPEFSSERLGRAGHWQGMGIERLRLDNPVQPAALTNLLKGSSPDGTRALVPAVPDPQRTAAWRLTFSASQSASVLWAMAPHPSSLTIERVHDQCVEAALIDFEQQICGHELWAPQHVADQFLGGVFASFRCGASWDQTPHLHTTVLVLNLGLRADGATQPLTADQVRATTCSVAGYYRAILARGLRLDLGPFRRFPCADLRIEGVPQELCRRFLFDPKFSNRSGTGDQPSAPGLRGAELLVRWRQQGRAFGWGPAQASALLDDLKRRQTWQPFDPLKRRPTWHQFKERVRCGMLRPITTLRGGRELPKQKPPSQDQQSGGESSTQSKDRNQGHSH